MNFHLVIRTFFCTPRSFGLFFFHFGSVTLMLFSVYPVIKRIYYRLLKRSKKYTHSTQMFYISIVSSSWRPHKSQNKLTKKLYTYNLDRFLVDYHLSVYSQQRKNIEFNQHCKENCIARK